MEQQAQKHICGSCNDEWLTEAEYNSHVCPSSNTTPEDPNHFGADFAEIQKAALQRGLDDAQANGDEAQALRNQTAIDQLDPQPVTLQ